MLEFIVLGQIPGTHIVISFYDVLFCVAFGLGVLTAHQVAHYLFDNQTTSTHTASAS